MPAQAARIPAGVARLNQVAVAALLSLHAVLLLWSAHVHSPTYNEPAHLVAGIRNWEVGRFDVYRVNPPLVHMVAAAPVLLAEAKTDWSAFDPESDARPEFALGEDFVAANAERSFWLVTLARWACVPFSLIGGCVCYLWARDLYGRWGGLLSLTLWCFSPNILGHGALITPDVAATSLGLAAAYIFWQWLREPTWGGAFTSGLVLGLAELAKMTLTVFFVIWPILWLVYRWPRRKSLHSSACTRELGMLAVQVLVAVYIVNLGYAFEGSLTPLAEFEFVNNALRGQSAPQPGQPAVDNRFADSWIGHLPVPLPKDYVLGIDLQKRDFEHYRHPSYLRGEFRQRGWWYYYLYALAIKVPLGTWLLAGLAACTPFRVTPTAQLRDEFILLCPGVVIVLFVSYENGFSEHMRYILPAFPFGFVWVGRLAPVFDRKHGVVGAIASGALAWSIASSLWYSPHSLSYFNELVGGPLGGPKHLVHSNVDWGQDLLYLKRWLQEHPDARPLKLSYFGYFDPIHAGIKYTAPRKIESAEEIPPGWYAISVNFVRGLPHFTYRGDGTKISLSQNALVAFQDLDPIAMAGYSIYIYHVPEAP